MTDCDVPVGAAGVAVAVAVASAGGESVESCHFVAVRRGFGSNYYATDRC